MVVDCLRYKVDFMRPNPSFCKTQDVAGVESAYDVFLLLG